jgi:hypothetical protein
LLNRCILIGFFELDVKEIHHNRDKLWIVAKEIHVLSYPDPELLLQSHKDLCDLIAPKVQEATTPFLSITSPR